MRLYIEIRPGEGGDDARSLVNDQAGIYLRFARRHSISADVLSAEPSSHG